jgi:WD40 repeat protein
MRNAAHKIVTGVPFTVVGITMRQVAWETLGVAIAFALGVGGCGGRVDQVNVGNERDPRDLAATQGKGGETNPATPTQVDAYGAPGSSSTAAPPLPACAMTKRTNSNIIGGLGSFSADGSLLAVTGNYYYPLQVFNTADDSVLAAFETPPRVGYEGAALSPDNSLVAASGPSDTAGVTVFHLPDKAVVATLPVMATFGTGVTSAEFSHDGRLLATLGGGSDSLDIWSIPDFRRVRAIPVSPATWVYSVDFSPDDTRLVLVSVGALSVWNVADGSQVWSRRLDVATVDANYTVDARFSPDGTQVVVAGGASRVVDASNGALLQKLEPSQGNVSFYADDHFLIGDDIGGARIWARDDATGLFAPSCLLTSERPPPSGPSPNGMEGPAMVAASPGGQHMYVHGAGSWIYEQAP